jgi:hypothetical protein
MTKTISSFAHRSAFAFVTLLLLSVTAFPKAVRADVASEGQAATAASTELWYKYIDSGPDASWEKVPIELKRGLSIQAWKMMLAKEKEISDEYGKCLGRKLISSTYSSSLEMKYQKKLDGDFVTIVYENYFPNKKSAFETFYYKKDASGAWPEIGYLIQVGDSPNL